MWQMVSPGIGRRFAPGPNWQSSHQISLFPCGACILERATNGFFIQVGGGRINQSISNLNGIPHGALALRELPHLKNAKSKGGHFDAMFRVSLFMPFSLNL